MPAPCVACSLVVVRCIDLHCGVVFGIPQHVYRQAQEYPDRKVICPNGHPFVYRTPEADRLLEDVKRLERETNDLRESRSRLERLVSTWKGVARRFQRRAAGGSK